MFVAERASPADESLQSDSTAKPSSFFAGSCVPQGNGLCGKPARGSHERKSLWLKGFAEKVNRDGGNCTRGSFDAGMFA
jgi:hypothetical protein